MSDLINASICVTDLPKSKIKLAENGKKYMNITIATRANLISMRIHIQYL